MRCLSRTRRLVALALVGGTSMAACVLANDNTPADWRTWDLGAFRMRVPAVLVHVAGGIDSKAGVFTAEGLRIEYDFGLYSDPLTRRDDMLDYQSSEGNVEGLAARFVRYRLAGAADLPARSCSGGFVPGVRMSGMGALKLTVLACAVGGDNLMDVPTIFESIRFQGPAPRS